MKLGFSEVEAVLREMHGIGRPAEAQFRARLRNLQRIGLKVSDGEGAGRRANYSAASVLKFAVAVELLQSGLPPERASILTTHNWNAATRDYIVSYKNRIKGDRSSSYLVVRPAILSSDTGVSETRFTSMSSTEVLGLLSDPLVALQSSRVLLLNITALLLKVDRAFRKLGMDTEGLYREIAEAGESLGVPE